MRILSKSRYTSGLQCLKQLWLKVHEPDAPELRYDAATRARFESGHRVGERARAEFPGGALIELDPRDREPALAATRAALDAGVPVIFEACFQADGAFAAIDVLERAGDGWSLLEVKATKAAKPQHVPDLAIQTHVAQSNGLRVERVAVMHLNRRHRHPDVEPLFAQTDVTAAVGALVPGVAAEVARQLPVLEGACPEVGIGDHCDSPYACPFKNRCWPELPKHDVSELYRGGRRAEVLRAHGYSTIDEIPDTEPLGPVQARQRRAVLLGRVVVEAGLGEALARLRAPLAFLDFETVNPPLPMWCGCAPFDAVVVQHSVHRLDDAGGLVHQEYIALPGSDSRGAQARHLLATTAGAVTVIAWNAGFERQRLADLAAHSPELAAELDELASRVVDLLPIVREHVYHPEFRGSFSLKQVGPALIPELAYDDLEVADGMSAAAKLEQYLRYGDAMSEREREEARAALLAYCARDTEILARVFVELRRLSDAAVRGEPGAG